MSPNSDHLQDFEPSQIEAAVSPMLREPLPSRAYDLLSRYLQLLTRWNQKINLTAVRDSRALVRLHVGECLRAAQTIPTDVETVLDFGSGAGLPGIPIQIIRPELRITLAESQKKKAAFLREVVRELDLGGAAVYAGRVEDMPASTIFNLVTLRAVDKMEEAMSATIGRIGRPCPPGVGWCMVLTSRSEVPVITSALANQSGTLLMEWSAADPVPNTNQRVILLGARIA